MGKRISFLSGQVKLETLLEANIFLCTGNPIAHVDRVTPHHDDGILGIAPLNDYMVALDNTLVDLFDNVKGWRVTKIRSPFEFDKATGKLSSKIILGDYGQFLTQDGFLLSVGAPVVTQQYGGLPGYFKYQYNQLTQSSPGPSS